MWFSLDTGSRSDQTMQSMGELSHHNGIVKPCYHHSHECHHWGSCRRLVSEAEDIRDPEVDACLSFMIQVNCSLLCQCTILYRCRWSKSKNRQFHSHMHLFGQNINDNKTSLFQMTAKSCTVQLPDVRNNNKTGFASRSSEVWWNSQFDFIKYIIIKNNNNNSGQMYNPWWYSLSAIMARSVVHSQTFVVVSLPSSSTSPRSVKRDTFLTASSGGDTSDETWKE